LNGRKKGKQRDKIGEGDPVKWTHVSRYTKAKKQGKLEAGGRET